MRKPGRRAGVRRYQRYGQQTLNVGDTLTIHRCSECGHIEGVSPQGGCCPNCGVASDSVPVKVIVALV